MLLRQLRRRPIGQGPLEVTGLEHFPEACRAPVGDQELEPGAAAQPPVAVVAEYRDDRLPHLRHLVERHPGAQPLTEHRVSREPAADPHIRANRDRPGELARAPLFRVQGVRRGEYLHRWRE